MSPSHPAAKQTGGQLSRYIATEAAMAVAANTLIGAIAFAVIFGAHPAAPLWGVHGVALDLVPTVLMMSLMGFLVPGLLTRQRVRRRTAPPSAWLPPRWLPTTLTRRAILATLLALLLLLPSSIGLFAAFGPAHWHFWPLFLVKAAIGVLVALLVAPISCLLELARPAAPPTP